MGNEIPRNSKPLRKRDHRRKKPIGALPSPQALPRREGAHFDVLTTVLRVLHLPFVLYADPAYHRRRMAAHRKSDLRPDDLCAGGLRTCVLAAFPNGQRSYFRWL